MDETPAPSAKQRIVILGGGFAGAYCAKALERFRDANYEVVLIDRHNYFVFYPLLIEAGTAKIEPRHTVVPLRPFLKRSRFLSGEIVGVDTSARKVSYHTPMREESGSSNTITSSLRWAAAHACPTSRDFESAPFE